MDDTLKKTAEKTEQEQRKGERQRVRGRQDIQETQKDVLHWKRAKEREKVANSAKKEGKSKWSPQRERKFSADTDEVIFINNTLTNANRQAEVCTDEDDFNGTICTYKHVCVWLCSPVCVCVEVCLVGHVGPAITQQGWCVREHCTENRTKER